MKVICPTNLCTGCSACLESCPRQCISMIPDDLGSLHPSVDESKCVDCGLCVKTCPNNIELNFKLPDLVYAAWSNDEKVRNTSASGGIAYELYRNWIESGGVATGVVYDRDEGCRFILVEKVGDLKAVQNSKYTFSNTNGIYTAVKEKLIQGVPVLFIGTPCQVAGLYGYLKKDYPILTTVDLICHGMPPAIYLEQHIDKIERSKQRNAHTAFFRDPKYQTSNFNFTIYDRDGNSFYRKSVLSNDNYQLGYHRALIYRENCYSCKYACKERISDLTIGDFSGVGMVKMCSYSGRNVSCILQNTDKGALLINELDNAIYKEVRPKEEAFEYEKQLKSPSVKHSERKQFESVFRETGNFSLASDSALKSEKANAKKKRLYIFYRTNVRVLFANRITRKIKKIIHG